MYHKVFVYKPMHIRLDCLPIVVQCQAAVLAFVSQWLYAVLLHIEPIADLQHFSYEQHKKMTASRGRLVVFGRYHFTDQAKSHVHYEA